MIQLKNVTKQYGDNFGLSDVNIKINDGEFVFLVGPSGAGKSTFIKLILKEIEPDEGSIYFDDMEVTSMSNRLVPMYRRNIGIVFQDFRLLQKKTVYENVAFAMEAVHQKRKLIKKQVPHILKLVGISEKADRYPHELSGGEQQRVAIARAIVNNPKVLIADEPTGNLDPEKSWEIMNLLNQINMRGTTIVMVTHEKDIVDRMGKRVIQIEAGSVVRDDQSGSYIEDIKPDTASVKKKGMMAHHARQKKYQEKLKKLGIKMQSDETRRISTEEMMAQIAELEAHANDEGGDIF